MIWRAAQVALLFFVFVSPVLGSEELGMGHSVECPLVPLALLVSLPPLPSCFVSKVIVKN
jgi:hypothetical protein